MPGQPGTDRAAQDGRRRRHRRVELRVRKKGPVVRKRLRIPERDRPEVLGGRCKGRCLGCGRRDLRPGRRGNTEGEGETKETNDVHRASSQGCVGGRIEAPILAHELAGSADCNPRHGQALPRHEAPPAPQAARRQRTLQAGRVRWRRADHRAQQGQRHRPARRGLPVRVQPPRPDRAQRRRPRAVRPRIEERNLGERRACRPSTSQDR